MAIFTQLVKVRRGKLVLALQSIRFSCPKSPKTECIRRIFLESEHQDMVRYNISLHCNDNIISSIVFLDDFSTKNGYKKIRAPGPPPPLFRPSPKILPFFLDCRTSSLLCTSRAKMGGHFWWRVPEKKMFPHPNSGKKAFISSGTIAFTVIIPGVTFLVLRNLSTTRYYFTRL